MLPNMEQIALLQKCDLFQGKYFNVIGSNCSLQFLNVYHTVLPELTEMYTGHQLNKEIKTKLRVLECDISEVYTAMSLFDTIPVTTAGAERSLSKLKTIKSYLRNSTGQDRLKHLLSTVIEKRPQFK